MQREEMELLTVRATLWRMEIELLREIHRYRFAKRGRRFGSDVELMIVYGAAMLSYGFGTPVRALPISRYLEMPRETVRRHMGRLVALGLFERAQDQSFVPTKELRKVEIERALRLLRHGTAGLLWLPSGAVVYTSGITQRAGEAFSFEFIAVSETALRLPSGAPFRSQASE